MSTTRTTGKYFSISNAKLDDIVSRCITEEIRDQYNLIAQAALDEDSARDLVINMCLDQDWPEGDEHQDWLNTAAPAEITNWVLIGRRI